MPSVLDHLPVVASAKFPATYAAARKALSECSRIDECQQWANKAEALASYAKQAKDDQLRNLAKRIQARAIRRCGELLKQVEPAKNQHDANARDGTVPSTRTQAATDAGLSERQRKTALRVASVDDETFNTAIDAPVPPTITELAEWGRASLKPAEAWLDDARALETFARFCGQMNAADLAANIPAEKRNRFRAYVGEIDSWLDTFITSLN